MSCGNTYKNVRGYYKAESLADKRFWGRTEFGEFWGTKIFLLVVRRVGRRSAEVRGNICCFQVQAMVLGS